YRAEIDGSKVEVLAHNFRNNYEVTLDSYGNLWQSDNDDDGHKGVRINFVMEYGNYGYKDEKTGAGWLSYRTGMSNIANQMHWHQNDPGVVPNLIPTGAGSPTGIAFYEGSHLPKKAQNAPIHADAGPRIIRAYPTKNSGAGYKAEMLSLLESSNDKWFRPSDVCVAPDGSIFVADWYDPGVGGNHMGDLKQGRIYRLAPKDAAYKFSLPDYSNPEGAALALESPNLATRAKAWLRLYEMGQLAEDALAERWKQGPAHQRARALWLLARIPEIGSDYVLEALEDKDPNIRITALRVVRQMDINLLDILDKMASDDSPQVRREIAIALRFQEGHQANQIWARLAERLPENDRWYLEALGIGADNYPDARFAAWQNSINNNWDTPNGHALIWRMRAKAALPYLGQIIAQAPDAKSCERFFRAFDFHESSRKNAVLLDLINEPSAQNSEMQYLIVSHMTGNAVQKNKKSKELLATVLDSLGSSDRYFDLVEKLQLQNQANKLLNIALIQSNNAQGAKAAQLLGKMGKLKLVENELISATGEELLTVFKTIGHINSPEALDILESYATNDKNPLPLRKSAVRNLAKGWNGETRMVEIIESERLPYEIGEAGATQLLGVWRAQYRTVASKYLKLDDQETQLAPIHELVLKSGEPSNGKVIYQKYCANCHTAEGEGIAFGPSLDEIGNKLSKDALYAAILKPSAGISFGYEAWLITMLDGSVFQGYISSRTDEAIQLIIMGGLTQNIARENIKSLEKQEQSLMTEGLYRLMSEAELVDLVSYLSQLRGQSSVASN
ncbi:MAG: PVC-type heme-binding CxxCH protein, partial [Bacteroidia bacterium]